MTIVRTASLICDAKGCDAWFGHDDTPASIMRADAGRAGWTRRVRSDFCPDHSTPKEVMR